MWINLEHGAKRRLNSLLTKPLSFDAVDFYEKTPSINSYDDNLRYKLLSLSRLFNEAKQTILLEMPIIYSEIRHGINLIGPNDFSSNTIPITTLYLGSIPIESFTLNTLCCDINNQQIERILEFNDITDTQIHTNKISISVSNLIKFFTLSEILYLSLSGLAEIDIFRNEITITPNSNKYENFFKPKWFANFWESMSSISNIALFNMIPTSSPEAPFIKSTLQSVSDFLMDKTFSINSQYLTDKITSSETYIWMKLVSDLIAVLFYFQLRLNRNWISFSELESFDISKDNIMLLKSIQQNANSSDRIFSFTNNRVSLINPCISMHSRKLIETLVKIYNAKEFDNIMGDFFHKSYIANYIKKSINKNTRRYILHGEIVAHDVFKNNKDGDIDLILEDTVANRFIFMQIKYIRNAGRPFLRGDVEYLTNKHIQHGIYQLKSIADFHKEGCLDQILINKNISHCEFKNTIYMLVTNITNLDFQKDRNNIVHYEWNTLRNLLQDGSCYYGDSNSPLNYIEWRHSKPLPLEAPGEVIDILMTHNPALKQISAEQIFMTKDIQSQFELNGTTYKSIGLGI